MQNIVVWHERMGKSADEIASEYGLTLAEIYAALSYYFDHQDEINTALRESKAFIEGDAKTKRFGISAKAARP